MRNFRAEDMGKRGGSKRSEKPQPTQLPAEPDQTQHPQGDGLPTPLEQEQQGAPGDTNLQSPPPQTETGEVPSGTTAEILQWVGGDKGRAQQALDVEQAHSSPRHGLTGELNKILSE